MTDELDPRAVLAQVQERIILPRVGLSYMREMDRDIVALRQAADAISALADACDRVRALIIEHSAIQAHNESVPINRFSDLQMEPTAERYLSALEGTAE